MSHVEAESTTNQTNKSSRAGHVFLLLPEIPLAAVHEISSPNRSPTNPARSRAVGEDRSAVPIIPFPPTKLFTCSPSRRAEKQKKKTISLCFAHREPPPPLMDFGKTKFAAATTAAVVLTLEATSSPSGLPFSALATPWFRKLWVNASK